MNSLGKQTTGLYPLVLEPIFKYRIWGGRRLGKMLGKELPAGEPIGESWETSCRGEDNNVIKNGDLAGRTLADALREDRVALLGPALAEGQKFPVLNKFIDAHELLSVQVHPNERVAREIVGAEPKTEAWYVMHADPGATLIKGLRPGVTKEIFEEAILNDTVPTVLNSVPVSTGDMVFVPAGCVHAMGKGLVICEIQQNSDTTFRVYDWGRVGVDGKPRQLHVEQALRAINFDDRSPDRVTPVEVVEGGNRRAYLIACPHFAMQRLVLEQPSAESTGGRRFESLMLVSGSAEIRAEGRESVSITIGDSLLIPACIGEYEIAPADSCEVLRIFVPDVEEEIVRALVSRGIDEEAVDTIVFQ
jgi:mannose-6-phosphate isomerase